MLNYQGFLAWVRIPFSSLRVLAQEIYQLGRLFALGAEGWEFESPFLDLLMLEILYYISFMAALCQFISDRDSETQQRRLALGGAISTFFVSLLLGPSLLDRGFFMTGPYSWFGTSVLFGADGVSYLFVLLSIFLTIICVLASWSSVFYIVKEFLVCLIVLEFLLIVLFTTWDLLVFYVFFEALLIPMVLIIGVWGLREEKVRAAYYFFFYTFGGSVCLLISILGIRGYTGTTDYFTLSLLSFPLQLEYF